MAKGRPPDLLFDPDHPGPVVQTAVYIDDRGRLQLPKKITGNLSWISKTATSYALAVLAEPGLVRLHSWDVANAIVQRRWQLIQQAATEPSAIDLLRALEDRYKRFQIPLGGRPTLTSEMILHLGLAPFTATSIYAWRVDAVVELTSSAHRNKQLEVYWEEFSDLPH